MRGQSLSEKARAAGVKSAKAFAKLVVNDERVWVRAPEPAKPQPTEATVNGEDPKRRRRRSGTRPRGRSRKRGPEMQESTAKAKDARSSRKSACPRDKTARLPPENERATKSQADPAMFVLQGLTSHPALSYRVVETRFPACIRRLLTRTPNISAVTVTSESYNDF